MEMLRRGAGIVIVVVVGCSTEENNSIWHYNKIC